MKLVKYILYLTFFLFLVQVTAQNCKFSNKMRKHAQKRLENENILNSTKNEVTFKDFNKVGTFHFVKSAKGYFLGLSLLRDFSRKMDATVDNALILKLKNDSLVEVFPYVPAKDSGRMGITTPMGTKTLKAYYNISLEQLRLFASMPIKEVKIYVTLRKKDEEGENELEILDFEVKKEKWRSSIMELANCVLQL